jgi:phospholipase/carboxylesterase
MAVGYSNGANMVSIFYFDLRFYQMLFFLDQSSIPYILPNLSDNHILISAGSHDLTVPSHHTEDLFELLRGAGANISIQWQKGGHELTLRDTKETREWVMS